MQKFSDKLSSHVARFESLEARNLLSASPNFQNSSDAGGNYEYSLVSGVPDDVPSPVDVSGLLDELWDDSTDPISDSPSAHEVGSEASFAFDSSPSDEDLPCIIADIFAVTSLDDISETYVDDPLLMSLLGVSGGSSDGSSSGGGDIAANYSGGGIVVGPESWIVREGQTIIISLTGGALGDVISATISRTVSNDEQPQGLDDFEDMVLQATIGTSSQISVKIKSDSVWGEGDESFSINLLVTNGISTLSRSSFNFTIVELPEFISDVDTGAHRTHSAPDSYKAYVPCDAHARTNITTLTQIASERNDVTYSLATVSDYFQIDPQSGVISLSCDVSEILRSQEAHPLPSNYSHLVVKIALECYSSLSGGDVFCDFATVDVTISQWDVDRQGQQTANVTPVDGCTVATLAKEIGLTASDFPYWLTFSPNAEAYLFDGTTKPWSQIQPDDVLAAYTYTNLAVPNTMVLAWFGECSEVGKSWMNWDGNKTDLEALGFRVEVFDNDNYGNNDAYSAKSAFLNKIWNNSCNKSFHGLYMMGHGATTSFGSKGSNTHIGGPEWAVSYLPPAGVEGEFHFERTSFNNRQLDSIYSALLYHMGTFIIHGCNGDNANSRKLVTSESTGGIFWGDSGTYYPIPFGDDYEPIAKRWGAEVVDWNGSGFTYLIGGLQGTKKFYLLRRTSFTETD